MAAAAHVRATNEETLADQLELTGIPAPPFREEARGLEVAARFARAGLARVRIDDVGNVLGLRHGAADLPVVILSAHIDTVFGEDIPIRVTRDGARLAGPGISDDGRGLAVMLAVARALEAGRVETRRPVLFAATVGEEGLGDLRGAKRLVASDGAGHGAAAFISVDGAGVDRIVTRGLGSRRFRVRARATGGHSWVDRGLSNPIHALGRIVAALARIQVPIDPASALTVARWGGGTSINSIPQEAWVEIDSRSTSDEHLEAMESTLRRIAATSANEENSGSRDQVTLEVERIGLRPAGVTDSGSALVAAVVAATRAVGAEPIPVVSSTDANAAMAAGIPAVTFGGGGEAGLAHTTEEWYHDVRGPDGVVRALYATVLIASE